MTEGLDGAPALPGAVVWRPAPSGPITTHFRWSEAVCRHCDRIPGEKVVQETAEWLELVRAALGGLPVTCNSWCRCDYWNEQVGGAPNSFHPKGMAVDITVRGLSPTELWRKCKALQKKGLIGGVGRYPSFVHVDLGPNRSWVGP
jgi:hypothetical protein